MADCAGCCPTMTGPAPRVLDLERFSILFDSPTLCIARCNACGHWLVNDGDCWEPLLQQERRQLISGRG